MGEPTFNAHGVFSIYSLIGTDGLIFQRNIYSLPSNPKRDKDQQMTNTLAADVPAGPAHPMERGAGPLRGPHCCLSSAPILETCAQTNPPYAMRFFYFPLSPLFGSRSKNTILIGIYRLRDICGRSLPIIADLCRYALMIRGDGGGIGMERGN